jgi:hypothetical protein
MPLQLAGQIILPGSTACPPRRSGARPTSASASAVHRSRGQHFCFARRGAAAHRARAPTTARRTWPNPQHRAICEAAAHKGRKLTQEPATTRRVPFSPAPVPPLLTPSSPPALQHSFSASATTAQHSLSPLPAPARAAPAQSCAPCASLLSCQVRVPLLHWAIYRPTGFCVILRRWARTRVWTLLLSASAVQHATQRPASRGHIT